MSSMATTHIQDLPTEILFGIFAYLSRSAPSERSLHEQPDAALLRADPANGPFPAHLKSISCVCKRWRAIILPVLFRNVIWRPQISSFESIDLRPHDMLRFLKDQDLAYNVLTFTLMVDFATEEVEESELHRKIWPGDLAKLWTRLFSVIDPLRFTIMAPPATLAAFMNRMLFLTDAWSFDIPYHIFSLAWSSRQAKKATVKSPPSPSLEPQSTPGPSQTSTTTSHNGDDGLSERRHVDLKASLGHGTISLPDGKHKLVVPPTSTLFTIRPWTSVLLNEGSSIRAYHTYEYFLRQPPSMLSALLGTGEYPNNVALLPPTIVDFNYIAVFPLASHIQNLFANLPKIERLFVQLTPRPSNQILQDKKAMRNIDMADLWMERNTAYSHLFAELTQVDPQGNWGTLKVFESGDAADRESWNMAVEFLKQSEITNWVVERDGSLVKVGEDGDDKPAARSAGSVVHHLLGDESLSVPLLSVPPPSPPPCLTLDFCRHVSLVYSSGT
ncbi:hypothetical protein PFICI_06157 [Pestalotiopsis fici W106-1]|uniref:F-box domain-containing protein n=1 Tax=Pestalotiopsis fici (strain W106-1 / CGMCC3.15140) TaxID=1229662 RepID=W3X522_PESFW|nr:uncharacterized protein PFICI_06157 [Pestalotiopsis fici W106-1]ETS81155.1 hypothetical protein PFICI_06157 [Pestalotiopsis fici W106-1]